MPTSVCLTEYGPEVKLIDLNDLPKQDVGAPLPTIFAVDGWTVLGYWTWHNGRDYWAVIGFRTTAVSMGMPNDEALHGHPLKERGLEPYRNYEIFNSPWVTGLEHANRVHTRHALARYASLQHVIMTFHDSLFEIVTSGYTHEIIHPDETDP